MKGFTVTTKNKDVIQFAYYSEAAPVTVAAFDEQLPFTRTFFHARVSGQECWIDNAPPAGKKKAVSSYISPIPMVLHCILSNQNGNEHSNSMDPSINIK